MTVKLILAAILFAVLTFLAEHNYTDGLETLFGTLGIAVGLIIVSAIIGLKSPRKIRKIYIMYAPEDNDFVAKLYQALKVAPYKILWDKKEIQVGEHIEDKANQLLRKSDDIIFVVSQHSAPEDWSKPAIEKISQMRKRIFPVLIDDSEIPEALKEIKFADFSESFDDGYFSLRDALKTHEHARPTRIIVIHEQPKKHKKKSKEETGETAPSE